MLKFLSTAHRDISKEKKNEKKRKQSIRLAMAGMARFFEKILPDRGGWRFFQKPVGLDLDRPCAMACVRQPIFA